jgi:hypothetical protein
MVNINDTQLKLAVTKHLNKLSLEEVQKIFNQNLDYGEIASEYVYSTGLKEKGYHSDNNWGDLDKDKEWLVDQLIDGTMNDYDGCTTLGELACQLGVDASPKIVDVGEPTKAPQPLEPSENKDYEELIKLYDYPMERAIARELFKLDQDQLRALLYEAIEHDELVEWHKLWNKGVLSETDLEERLSEDKEWIVEEIILHTPNTSNLARDLRLRPQRRYLTVEVFGYDLTSVTDVKVLAMSIDQYGNPLDKIYTDVIEMTDEDGKTL